MTHALVTVVAPLAAAKLKSQLGAISAMGNPANPFIKDELSKLDQDGQSGTHFASLHAIPAGTGKNGYLILEFSADGSEEEALARLARQIEGPLTKIFSEASDWHAGGTLLAYLRRHVIKIGYGLFSSPGVAFAGTPGMTVGRIRDEAKLSAEITKVLGAQRGGMRAIDRLAGVRAKLATSSDWAWALDPPPPALPENAGDITTPILGQMVRDFAVTYLWPFGLVVLAWVIYAAVTAWPATFDISSFMRLLGAAVPALWWGTLTALLLFAAIALALYLSLLNLEAHDWIDERWPEREVLEEIFARENFGAQNHMVSVTRRKPGIVRYFTIRLVFWLIAEFVTRVYKPGFLSDIGTIHFARWITVPGTRDFIFFSNYGDSWESYLEDFITRAHLGLTGVWSNSIGFPRSNNLIEGGASDGERFKRYARRSMLPTLFWYSAYPDTKTSRIRTNAGIRRGLASALTNEEALDWLALFGSAARPDETIESSEVQSIVFGGLGFLPFGTCVLYELSSDLREAQALIRGLAPEIAFNDGRRLQGEAVITLGLGPRALAKLGLPEECVKGFPAAFLAGMAERARILGDIGENAPEHWSWGTGEPLDLAILIYGTAKTHVAELAERIAKDAARHRARKLTQIDLVEVKQTGDKKEPFGFVDGISQPLIRGTYKSLRQPDSIHIVEPGEFLLGYPDNRGNIPPGPTLSPLLDPHNRLPIAADEHAFSTNIVNVPRDVGRSGTFLVIRQLAQDVGKFGDYCREEAERLQNRLGPPYQIDENFIAAKLVGRWKDGSSLVRHPYTPRSKSVSGDERLRALHEGQAPKPYGDVSPGLEKAISRPPTNPKTGSPIQGGTGSFRPADNDFLFGQEDPEALRCPFGAHIRRANPRESLDPGSKEQIDITNRHRVMRVGRFYQPAPGANPGLLFMCLNGDLERQFEFIQQTWLESPSFHGLEGEQDPLVGGDSSCTGFTIPTRDGPVRLKPLARFIRTLGGGYFFLPSKRLLNFLGGDN